jgi:uncharacterized protein YceK
MLPQVLSINTREARRDKVRQDMSSTVKKFHFIGSAAIAVLLFNTGCASVASHTQGRKNQFYSGVREDIHFLIHPKEADLPWLQWMCVIDLPLSSASDTLFLPLDLASKPVAKHTNDFERTNPEK